MRILYDLGGDMNLTLSESTLYGMTGGGGIYGYGVIVKLDTSAVAGINNISATKGLINVYPNPSTGQFTIAFNTPVTGTIEIYDITGQRVYQQTIQSKNTEINLSGQPAGMYFYRALTNAGSLIGEGKLITYRF